MPESAGARSSDQRDRALTVGLAWTGAAKWSAQIATWAATLGLARLLAPHDYGVWSLATVYLGLVTLISEFGLGASVVMLRDLDDEHIAHINGASLVLGLASALLSVAVAWPIGWLLKSEPLPSLIVVLSIVFVIASFRTVPQALLQKDLQFRAVALIDAFRAITQAVTIVVLAWLGFGYWALAAGAVVAELVSTGATLRLRRHPMRRPRLSEIRGAVSFSTDVVTSRLSWYLYSNSDFLIVGRMLGEAALGFYGMAWSIAGIPADKVTSLVTSVTPAFFSAVQKELDELRRYVLALSEGISLLAFPAAIGLALVTDDFVHVVLSSKWEPAIMPMRLLALFTCVRAISPILTPVLLAVGDTRFVRLNSLLALILLPPSFAIASRWGIGAVAAVWLAVHPVTLVLLYRRTFTHIQLSAAAYLKALWPALSGVIGMTACVLLVRTTLGDLPRAALFAVEVTAGAAGYLTLLLLLHRKRLARLRAVLTAGRLPTS